jgi:O-antigen/teichoic acid export membrane protein
MNVQPPPLWKRHFWRNTGSSYIRTITRLLLGLVLFRLLFSGLSAEQFGFWSLLWSLFGYGILLDFGFGFTAQRAVAEKSATGDWIALSRLLSTLLWTFVGLAVLIALVFLLVMQPFLNAVDVPIAERASYASAYLIFFFGLALTFPFGLFPEILQGMQRLDLANMIRTTAVVLNFIGITIALWLDAAFTTIVLISVATTLLPNVVAMIVAMRRLPEVSLAIKHFDFAAVRPQLGFSIAAYLITFSNILMSRSDQAVIGFVLGVGAITIYQAGYKVAEMFNLFTIQLQDALGPAAASMHALGDRQGLKDLLLRTSQLTFVIATPLYALCAVYLDPLIRLLTGLDTVAAETLLVGHLLLIAIYSSQLTNSCAKRILMMCGHERKLLGLSLLDGFANVTLSVVLAFQIGLAGVALGTLIPTVVVGWGLVLPLAIRYLELSPRRYVSYIIANSRPLVLFAACLAATTIWLPIAADSGFWDLALRGAIVGGPTGIWILVTFRHAIKG